MVILFRVLLSQGCSSSTNWGSATELNALVFESEPIGVSATAPLKRSVRVTVWDKRVQKVETNDTRLYDAQVEGNV